MIRCVKTLGMWVCVLGVSTALSCGVRNQGSRVPKEGLPARESSEKEVDFRQLKNPVPYTNASIARGNMIYVRFCAACHGPDGKGLLDYMGDVTDLTAPERWRYGTTEGEIFHSTRDGAGTGMPAYKFEIRLEEDIWHTVNFIQSLWPVSMRPQLQEEREKKGVPGMGKGPSEGGGTSHE